MIRATDQLQRLVLLPQLPQRIISLVPSQTELLFDLGLGERVVGITKFCIHPESWFRTKARVGGTKDVKIDRVRALQPDLVIANREENVKELVEELAKEFPVWVSEITDLPSALQMISGIGALTGTSKTAATIVKTIEERMSELNTEPIIDVAYLIWKDPFITVGGDSFISDLLLRGGFRNVFAENHRYPEITLQQLAACKAKYIFLSSEPYPFREKHLAALKAVLPDKEMVLVDGEMFSWYGSRLIQSVRYISDLRAMLKTA